MGDGYSFTLVPNPALDGDDPPFVLGAGSGAVFEHQLGVVIFVPIFLDGTNAISNRIESLVFGFGLMCSCYQDVGLGGSC